MRIIKWGFLTVLFMVVVGAIALSIAIMITNPTLPNVNTLADYKPKIPLRIYTQDGILLGEFGEERRSFVKIEDIPLQMKQALLAGEDERFYAHGGVDYIGLARAILGNMTGGTRSGASTITMQVAKNFFLSPEQTASRKFKEALLAHKIEAQFSKDQILELYMNQIYLGERAYGFASASQTYFAKPMAELSLAEAAMLAGLPKSPSKINPVKNLARSKLRQEYILRKMHELGNISTEEMEAAKNEVIKVNTHTEQVSVLHGGEYIAEMVRKIMADRYHETAFTEGYKVYTTLKASHQEFAYNAVRQGVLDYDQRHGYRGIEGIISVAEDATDVAEATDDELNKFPDVYGLPAAAVLEASPKRVKAFVVGGEMIEIKGSGLKFAAPMLSSKANAATRIRPGAVIRVQKVAGNWKIVQLPAVESGFVSINPQDGSIQSLVGGFDFKRNQFNHVTQAWRQPGSSFKPFIYSAALEKGFTPQTMINDAPVVIHPDLIGGQDWNPKNYDGGFSGMMSMRTALTFSKNLVSIRILQAISPQFAQEYIAKFGFSAEKHPAYLTMALGAGSVTVLEMAAGYSVFANHGYRVLPYYIDRIEDGKGIILARTKPERAGDNAIQTIDPRNAFIMTNMMQDVVSRGTATRANALGRTDLAGKTGTTNDAYDAWFAGFHPQLVAVVWLGFDQPKSLGAQETGGASAVPIWVNYMKKALKGVPNAIFSQPNGMIELNTNGRADFVYQEFAGGGTPTSLDNSNAETGQTPSVEEANIPVEDEPKVVDIPQEQENLF